MALISALAGFANIIMFTDFHPHNSLIQQVKRATYLM